MPYYPVFSFGNPVGKPLILIGINPSKKEFEEGFLSNSNRAEDRRISQLTYFEREPYNYFKKVEPFFGGPVKKVLGWKESPWEKVGTLDLIKCSTVKKNGQWNELTENQQRYFIANCESYLIRQLKMFKPDVVISYGVKVCEWFSDYLNTPYYEYKSFTSKINDRTIRGIFIPQRQGNHSVPEIVWVQRKLKKII